MGRVAMLLTLLLACDAGEHAAAFGSGGNDLRLEGLTDRFGDPVQWLSHETTGSLDMPIERAPP